MNLTTAAHRLVGLGVSGTPIWEFDWDICTVLDGCRADTFRESHDCETYRSVASTSPTWIRRTFADAPGGVGYVTGNPFASEVDHGTLAYTHQEPVREVGGIETVPPDALADHAAALWQDRDEYGVDRIVVHFMQPHVPFRSRPEWFERFSGTDTWGSKRWKDLASSDISREEWFSAYRDNLDWVYSDGVERLSDRVDATIGVTADHGNAAGEWGIYGHPSGVAVPAVRRVPWHVVKGEQRKAVENVELNGEKLTSEGAERQLRALGYR